MSAGSIVVDIRIDPDPASAGPQPSSVARILSSQVRVLQRMTQSGRWSACTYTHTQPRMCEYRTRVCWEKAHVNGSPTYLWMHLEMNRDARSICVRTYLSHVYALIYLVCMHSSVPSSHFVSSTVFPKTKISQVNDPESKLRKGALTCRTESLSFSNVGPASPPPVGPASSATKPTYDPTFGGIYPPVSIPIPVKAAVIAPSPVKAVAPRSVPAAVSHVSPAASLLFFLCVSRLSYISFLSL